MTKNRPSNNPTRLTQAGIRAVNAGHNAEARQLLRQALELDENNESAWLWLAAAVDTPSERRVCLNNVLRINPRNETARRALAKINEANQLTQPDSFESLRTPSDDAAGHDSPRRRFPLGMILAGMIVLIIAGIGGIELPRLITPRPTATLPPSPTLNFIAYQQTSDAQAMITASPSKTSVVVASRVPPPASWTPLPTFTPAAGFTPTSTPLPLANLTLAFVGRPSQSAQSSLYLVKADGSGQHAFPLQTGGTASDPAWSSDGAHLAFVNTANGLPQLVVADAHGGHQTTVTHFAGSYLRSPAWSPDGTQLVFAATDPNSPAHHAAIYLVQADGSNLTPLTDGSAESHDPAWSPDGHQIVYATDVIGQGSFQIYILDLSNAQRHALTNSLKSNFSPVWSPDGSQIAFVSTRDGHAALYVMAPDGSNQRLLSYDAPNAENREPSWSPDSQWLAFSSNRDGGFAIYVMNLGSTQVTRLTDPAQVSSQPHFVPNLSSDAVPTAAATVNA